MEMKFVVIFVYAAIIKVALGGVTKTYVDCLQPGYDGNSSTLICRVNETIENGIQWFRPNGGILRQVIFCDQSLTVCLPAVSERGYSAKIDPNTREVTLKIHSFDTKVDAGNWTCADGAWPGEGSPSCEKTFLSGPDNVKLIKSTAGEVIEGDYLNLTCVADCNPPCSFSWMLEQTEISSSSQLRFNNINTKQNGEVYTCIAHNPAIPKYESKNFTLAVKSGKRGTHSLSSSMFYVIILRLINITGLL